jgi:flap endonuclease-1
MGVNLKGIIPSREIELQSLAGKRIAFDAYNMLYQFLSIIRDKFTGEYLKDSKGRVTSHLSGLFYRTANFVEIGIKPIFVFDGKPPEFKKKEIERREKIKEEAEIKWAKALERGEEAIKYAQATARLSDEMIEDAKELLTAMGIPWVVGKSEGEAQCSFLCKRGDADYSASQDYDSLLFGSPRLVRNLSITGKRKLPGKEVYIEVKPELIILEDILKSLGITREQLIIIGILTGTDYNAGVKGIGPKKALKIVKEYKSLDKILANVEWEAEVDAREIVDFFLNPPLEENYKIEWRQPDREKILKLMVDEHNFSQERVEKTIAKLEAGYIKYSQKVLTRWFYK